MVGPRRSIHIIGWALQRFYNMVLMCREQMEIFPHKEVIVELALYWMFEWCLFHCKVNRDSKVFCGVIGRNGGGVECI